MTTPGTIGFIGGGNMAEALIKGLMKGAMPPGNILVSEPSESRRRLLEEKYGVGLAAENLEAVRTSDLVVLAVKPQVVDEALGAVAAAFRKDQLLVSILAGVKTEALEGYFDVPARVVRAMPNTPALVAAGATAVCPGRHATPADLLAACRLFEAVGTVHEVDEGQMDAVTGLSGSGPAYVFTLIEAMADGGVQEGLPRETALALATQTVFGAARLVKESGEHPAQLRDKVCSPGGTTIAAVRVLEKKGLRSALMEAVAAAAQRSRQLGGD